MRFYLFTDGASRGNPGPAAAGVVLKKEGGQVVAEKRQLLGRLTNNEAEYRALLLGLLTAKENASVEDEITVLMDSELAVSQIKGSYKIKAPHLKELIKEVKEAQKNFSKITFQLVPRYKNARADSLANQALDED
ncbi:MAG: ribonuclease HI family protein [Patescibacteria group bacterium]